MVKFLFREESVGERNWKNRFKIVKEYNEKFTFVNTKNPISKSDFDMMLFELNKGVRYDR